MNLVTHRNVEQFIHLIDFDLSISFVEKNDLFSLYLKIFFFLFLLRFIFFFEDKV